MPHIKFNWIDIFFVTLLIRIGYIGFRNGLLSEFLRFLGLLIAFLLSVNNYTLISSFLSSHTKWAGEELGIISFLFIFLSVLLIFKIVTSVTSVFLDRNLISGLSKLVGMGIGFGRGILLISLIYALFVNSPFEYISKSARDRSLAGQYISNVASTVYRIGMDFYPGKKIDTLLARLLQT